MPQAVELRGGVCAGQRSTGLHAVIAHQKPSVKAHRQRVTRQRLAECSSLLCMNVQMQLARVACVPHISNLIAHGYLISHSNSHASRLEVAQ